MLRWVAAVSINLGKDGIEPHLAGILNPVYRELELATTYIGIDSGIIQRTNRRPLNPCHIQWPSGLLSMCVTR